jgi:hypothetical protein
MTATTAPHSPDTEPSTERYPVTAYDMVAKAMVGALPDSAAQIRHSAWSAYTARLAYARQSAPHRLPWQGAQDVTEVRQADGEAAIAAILAALKSHRERHLYELAHRAMCRAVKRYEGSQSHDSGKRGGKYERQCARPGCGMTFRTDQPTAKFHSDSCRQMAYRQAKRNKAARPSSATASQDQPRSDVHSPLPAQ